MKRLIVNADDYGRTPSISAGIRQAHRRGLVTSTTAMVNMPEVETDLHLALAECPRLGLGVHLTLTAEAPLLPPEQIASVVGLADGRLFPRLPEFLTGLPNINANEVAAEWRAQIEKFVRVTGRAPTHLDSHHHTSFMRPDIFATMLALAREQHCAIRNPLADPASARALLGDLPPAALDYVRGFLAEQLAATPDVRRPDYFEPRFYGENATLEMLLTIMDELPQGVTEIMCHPGIADESLAALTGYNTGRAAELAALTDPRARARLDSANIQLISFFES